MKLRDYIIIGYTLSFLITIVAVFWASNQMLIESKIPILLLQLL